MKFDEIYPKLSEWIECNGWIEIGADHYNRSLVRILDEGGLIWESEPPKKSLNEELDIAENFIKDWIERNT